MSVETINVFKDANEIIIEVPVGSDGLGSEEIVLNSGGTETIYIEV